MSLTHEQWLHERRVERCRRRQYEAGDALGNPKLVTEWARVKDSADRCRCLTPPCRGTVDAGTLETGSGCECGERRDHDHCEACGKTLCIYLGADGRDTPPIAEWSISL